MFFRYVLTLSVEVRFTTVRAVVRQASIERTSMCKQLAGLGGASPQGCDALETQELTTPVVLYTGSTFCESRKVEC